LYLGETGLNRTFSRLLEAWIQRRVNSESATVDGVLGHQRLQFPVQSVHRVVLLVGGRPVLSHLQRSRLGIRELIRTEFVQVGYAVQNFVPLLCRSGRVLERRVPGWAANEAR